MKRIISVIITLAFLMMFTACSGNFTQVDLKEPIAIPEHGIVEKELFEQIKDDNAIATLNGTSNGIKYEWTIFGSDIETTRDVNLSLELNKIEKGIKFTFEETEDFGFPALLSIHLNEKWTADSATAYEGNNPVYSVSITGSKTSILNISVNKIVKECVILPNDAQVEDTDSSTETNSSEVTEQSESGTTEREDYLSSVKDFGNRVYSDGNATDQDKYKTDPVPEGKPLPVEPENQEINN